MAGDLTGPARPRRVPHSGPEVATWPQRTQRSHHGVRSYTYQKRPNPGRPRGATPIWGPTGPRVPPIIFAVFGMAALLAWILFH
jgi:hypothetical protein